MLTAASFAGLQLVAMPTRWDAEKDAALVVEFSFATTVFEGVLLLYRGVRSEDRMPVVVAMELRSRPDAVHLIIAEPSRRLDLPFPVAAGNDDTAAVLRIARSHVSLTLHPDRCDFTDACF
ncbi:PREDICTED: uncharacterized protein LOC106820266, partial [Priapulus caudatus]|uniref:Uncharacterized protein LOC106820266 n=1 Tax=Priapulus caudatus TaxID=37621 RepID=A0ABM1F758_PRICU